MSGPTRKRFWKAAGVVGQGGGFAVRLDGRPLRLANGAELAPVGRALAEAVAMEWSLAGDAVGGLFGPDELVLTALVATLQQHVEPAPEPAVDRLLGFAAGELLCYRATDPEELVGLQNEGWQPWLDWLQATYGVSLAVGRGLMPVPQPKASILRLRAAMAGLTTAALTGLGVLVPGLGSLVLGLAVAAGRLEAAQAFRLSRLDEDFQASHWGHDREAETQAARVCRELAVAARFIELAGG